MSLTSRIFRIFLLFGLGFFLTSIYRTMDAILAIPIGLDLGIKNSSLASITSLYFLGFALMQIPVGILIDHFGPGKVQALLFITGAMGIIIYGIADGPILLSIGRLISGIGMAGGLMAGFASTRLWFESKNVPLLNNLIGSIGALGALASAKPLQLLTEIIHWRTICFGIGLATILLAIAIAIFVPKPKKHSDETFKQVVKGIKDIAIDPFFWRVAPLGTMVLGFLTLMQSFWLLPFLENINGVAPKIGSYYLVVIAISTVIGPTLIGFILHYSEKIHLSIEKVLGIAMFIAILIQCLIGLNLFPKSLTLWFFASLFMITAMSFYSLVQKHFPKKYAGRVVTFYNTISFLSVFIRQYLFGLFVEFFPGTPKEKYLTSFWIFLALQILAFIWYCVGKGRLSEQR